MCRIIALRSFPRKRQSSHRAPAFWRMLLRVPAFAGTSGLCRRPVRTSLSPQPVETGVAVVERENDAGRDQEDHGDGHRRVVLVPDSAHGTNPASAAMVGYEVVSIPSDTRGNMDLQALKAALSDRVAAIMLTLPSTLGLFDENIVEICRLVHSVGEL